MVYSVDENGNNVGFFSDAQLDVLAENAKAVENDSEVIAAKAKLALAKVDAYYSEGSETAADSERTMTLAIRKLLVRLGYKYDNKAAKFDGKGHALFCNLWSCGTDKLSHTKAVRHNGDDETPCMLRTTAEIAGWLGDTCAEYVKSLGKGKAARKGVADKVKAYYKGCIDFDDTPEVAITKAAKKFDLSEDQVNAYIK